MENQVRMCMEYISANIPGSAEAKIFVYEDEGFSGKNTKRPRFQQMMEDMRKNHFQYLVCYRLDRLGRNIADLALLIDKLNRENTEFISIRERFDTTTPMGKAMLYFSGSGTIWPCWPETADGWAGTPLWALQSGKRKKCWRMGK